MDLQLSINNKCHHVEVMAQYLVDIFLCLFACASLATNMPSKKTIESDAIS